MPLLLPSAAAPGTGREEQRTRLHAQRVGLEGRSQGRAHHHITELDGESGEGGMLTSGAACYSNLTSSLKNRRMYVNICSK